jgi:hypothetical protein
MGQTQERKLWGIVTLDDLLRLLGKEIGDLAEVVHTELTKESAATNAPQ